MYDLDIQFRTLDKNDEEQLYDLMLQTELTVKHKEWWECTDNVSINKIFENDNIGIGAFLHDKLIAACILTSDHKSTTTNKLINGSSPLPDAGLSSIMELSVCMVAPAFKGRGLMVTLCKKLIEIAKEKQVGFIIAYSYSNNHASDISLAKLGFLKVDSSDLGKVENVAGVRNTYVLYMN